MINRCESAIRCDAAWGPEVSAVYTSYCLSCSSQAVGVETRNKNINRIDQNNSWHPIETDRYSKWIALTSLENCSSLHFTVAAETRYWILNLANRCKIDTTCRILPSWQFTSCVFLFLFLSITQHNILCWDGVSSDNGSPLHYLFWTKCLWEVQVETMVAIYFYWQSINIKKGSLICFPKECRLYPSMLIIIIYYVIILN